MDSKVIWISASVLILALEVYYIRNEVYDYFEEFFIFDQSKLNLLYNILIFSLILISKYLLKYIYSSRINLFLQINIIISYYNKNLK
jgi:hypothetical protein